MKKIFIVIFLSILYFNSFSQSHFLAKTSGKLPSLLYGVGEDRLGGAKMTYIDTNVLLRILDTTKPAACKVQLSKNRIGYIERQYFTIDSTLKEKPYYLSSNFNVFGVDSTGYDIVTINLEEKLPYRSWMQTEPNAIQLEIFGTQSNTNWITQLTSSIQEIKNVYYNQTSEDVMQVTIELNHKQQWGYTIYYNNNQLVIKVKHQPKNMEIKCLKIGIDAGHGGTNLGAAGATTKILEKNYTLLFAEELKKYLISKGVDSVVMTRETDTTLDMKDRIIYLQQQKPDFVISFHLNSNSDKNIKGCGTFYRYIGFRPPSLTILKRMQQIGLDEYGNVGNFNFGLNGPTDFVNTLLEVAFLSNKEDEKKLADPEFHKQTAEAVYKGIVDWLNDVKKDK